MSERHGYIYCRNYCTGLHFASADGPPHYNSATVRQTSLTEQNDSLACFVTELYAKLLRSSHDVIQAPSLATGCEPEGSLATGVRHQTRLAKSKPKNKTKIAYVRSQRAAPSLIWSQEAGFFFFGAPHGLFNCKM